MVISPFQMISCLNNILFFKKLNCCEHSSQLMKEQKLYQYLYLAYPLQDVLGKCPSLFVSQFSYTKIGVIIVSIK